MLQKIFLPFIIILLFNACSSDNYEKLKISSSTWIGYSPLFYAKEQGWFEPLNIDLVNVVSLSENVYLYEAGNSDAFVGTQYEYNLVLQKQPSLMPIMMFDRSNGGDLIMSNISLEKLQELNTTIDVYLEMDSINNTLLEYFIKQYHLEDKKLRYFNKDQTQISTLEAKKMKHPTLIVTYIPYNKELLKHGFTELVSTKDGLDIFVVDALFTKTEVLYQHQEQFLKLKALIDRALDVLKNDPHTFYTSVKPYMNEISYEEFQSALEDIVWIHQSLSKELLKRMKDVHFPTRDLI